MTLDEVIYGMLRTSLALALLGLAVLALTTAIEWGLGRVIRIQRERQEFLDYLHARAELDQTVEAGRETLIERFLQ